MALSFVMSCPSLFLFCCIDRRETLETLPLEEYKKHSELFDESVYDAISLERCVNGRKVLGGPASENVLREAARVRGLVEQDEKE